MEELRKRYNRTLYHGISLKTIASEVIGTFGFVLMGTGAAALYNAPSDYEAVDEDPMIAEAMPPMFKPDLVREAVIGFAFGIGIVFMIYATAHNNSGQLNPAVSIALIASGVLPILQGVCNICAQILGAIIASGILKALLPKAIRDVSALGANSVPDVFGVGTAFLAEAVGGFIAIYVILESVSNLRSKAKQVAPLAIGLTFGTLLTVLSPFSSGSFNPARSLGPAAVSGKADDLWIWIFGPIVGALLAVPFHFLSLLDFKGIETNPVDAEMVGKHPLDAPKEISKEGNTAALDSSRSEAAV